MAKKKKRRMVKKNNHVESTSKERLSYFEKYKRSKFKNQEEHFRYIQNLSDEEFAINYSNLESRYEFRKQWLTVVIGSVIVTTILSILTLGYHLVIKMLPRLLEVSGEQEQIMVLSVSIVIGLLLTILIFILYLANLFFKSMKNLKNEMILYQEIKGVRGNNGKTIL